MKYFTYILKSRKIKRYNIGLCSDLEVRLAKHNSGNSKSTKGYVPWEIVYFEEYASKSEAIANPMLCDRANLAMKAY